MNVETSGKREFCLHGGKTFIFGHEGKTDFGSPNVLVSELGPQSVTMGDLDIHVIEFSALTEAQAEHAKTLDHLHGQYKFRINSLQTEVERMMGGNLIQGDAITSLGMERNALRQALESSNKTIIYLMEEYANGNGLTVGRMTVDHNNSLLPKGGS